MVKKIPNVLDLILFIINWWLEYGNQSELIETEKVENQCYVHIYSRFEVFAELVNTLFTKMLQGDIENVATGWHFVYHAQF